MKRISTLINSTGLALLLLGSPAAQAGLFDDLKGLAGKLTDVLTAEPSATGQESDDPLANLTGNAQAEAPKVEKSPEMAPEQVSEKAPEKKPVKEPKSYSLFYDQGDYLAELIKAGQFADAERLFAEHKVAFFEQKGGLDRRSRMDKYASELRQLANALNETRKLPLLAASEKLSVIVEKPHSEAVWAEQRAALQAARTVMEEYRAHPLLGIPVYQDTSLMGLEAAIVRAEQRIRDRAIEVVLNNPPDLVQTWLANQYPVQVDVDGLVNRQSTPIMAMLAKQSRQNVADFHKVFGNRFDEGMLRGVGNLMLEKQDIKGVGDTRLRLAMKAWQEVKSLGLKPTAVKGLKLLFVERVGQREGMKFGSKLVQDVPFATETVELDTLAASAKGDFLVLLDIDQTPVQRKESGLKRVRSEYLSGYQDVSNPAYAEAKMNYERAKMSYESISNQDCSRDRSGGCGIGKLIGLGIAASSLKEAQQKLVATPEHLSQPVHKRYDYKTTRVDVSKTLKGKVYFVDMGALLYQVMPIEITDSASFPLAHELSPEDTQYAAIVKQFKTEQDVDGYGEQPMEIKLSALVEKYLADNAKSHAVTSLEQLLTLVAGGPAPEAPVKVAAAATAPAPLIVDPAVEKLQAALLAQRQQIKMQTQRERLEAELARLKETVAEKYDEDLHALLVAAKSSAKTPHVHVLAIGVGDYADVPDVPYAERSAQAFADLAKKALGAQDENVLLLTDAEATSGRLRGRLRTLLGRLTPADQLIVYYAGHGVPARDGKAAYLLAQDGGPGSYEEPDLQLDALYAQIDKSRVGQASLFIDACFSGRSGKDTIVFEGVGGITLVPRHGVRPDGRLTVLTAGRSDQFSNQDKAHGHRLFGYHLMKALLEGGPQQTAAQLHGKVRERVVQDSRRIGPEFEQEPELLGNAKAVVGW